VLGVVIELVRDDDVARPDVLAHAADSADGDDAFNAELLHAVDVRPVVDVRGHQAVSPAVARKEGDPPAEERADAVLVGRPAEGRGHPDGPDVREPLHLIEAAAADDADRYPLRFRCSLRHDCCPCLHGRRRHARAGLCR